MATVAVVGASRDANKISHQALLTFQKNGWNVIPINPTTDTIAGIKTVAVVNELTQPVDVFSFYVPAKIGKQILPKIKEHFPQSTIIFNPGAADADLLATAKEHGLEYREICSLVHMGELTREFVQGGT